MSSKTLVLVACMSFAASIGPTVSAAAAGNSGTAAAEPHPPRLQLANASDTHRGGVLRLVAEAAGGTIDPHINYTQQFFQIEAYLYDGLVAFKKVAGKEGQT